MNKFLPIVVDKSHLLTIGEKLYSESIELIRELVNNAYDADATEVKVALGEDSIVVEDNGSGMDRKGLEQYFNVGSPFKKIHSKSPRFQRDRIGQFGIGKFATLSACQRFEVYTQCGSFAATVTFDKEEWEKGENPWQLPLEVKPPNPQRGEGTTVTLSQMTRRFDLEAVEKRIRESVPLKAENFRVYLNGRPITVRQLPGRKIPFLEGTDYGVIHGEIVIIPSSQASTHDLGIECKAKQVTIKRELFGMESWGKSVARVKGEVHADFLPLTTDRSGFIVDSGEYKVFFHIMKQVMGHVREVLTEMTSEKENVKTRRALKDALVRVQKALALNPDFSPFGELPLADNIPGVGGAGLVSPSPRSKAGMEKGREGKRGKRKKSKLPRVRQLTPHAVICKVKIGHSGVSCCLDNFGPDGPECFSEGTTIFINRDHPLYRREMKKRNSHTMHLARLFTQEISLMKTPQNPRRAYECQSKLLRDAYQN
ncbi:ATP-binding protein [candidate division NPL-UPA2 bacterium]|nr:ATP-binding protein [candidate division NPL-UPA2 bacterium]